MTFLADKIEIPEDDPVFEEIKSAMYRIFGNLRKIEGTKISGYSVKQLERLSLNGNKMVRVKINLIIENE